jgi:hypothetical protein
MIMCNEGKMELLDVIVKGSVFPFEVNIRLYTNNPFTPTDATIASTMAEANYPGYSAIATHSLGWPAANINLANEGETNSPDITFQPSGLVVPQTVYGVYITIIFNMTTEALLFIEQLSTPKVFATDSDSLVFRINMFDQVLI